MQIHLTIDLTHLNGPEVKPEDLTPEVIDAFMDYFEGYEFSNIKTDETKRATYDIAMISPAKLNECDGCGIIFLGRGEIAAGDYKYVGKGQFQYNSYHNMECLETTHEKEGLV